MTDSLFPQPARNRKATVWRFAAPAFFRHCVESGDQRENGSNSQGLYSFPLLVPGHYTLTVEKDGFQSETVSGIEVLTASVSTVDVTLKVGIETQTVSVDASVPLLETETSTVAQVVENKSITNLPLVDRRSAQLQRLNGFVVIQTLCWRLVFCTMRMAPAVRMHTTKTMMNNQPVCSAGCLTRWIKRRP